MIASFSILGFAGINHRTETIVAINSDPSAPIFKQCDYYIVGTAEEVIPVVRPDNLFGIQTSSDGSRYIKLILVDTGNGKVGLVTKKILGHQEIVIKGLPSLIRGASGITGATILGSGRIAFIWDPRSLFKGRYLNEPH